MLARTTYLCTAAWGRAGDPGRFGRAGCVAGMLLILLALVAGITARSAVALGGPAPRAGGGSGGGSGSLAPWQPKGDFVVVLEVRGDIDLGLASFVRRCLTLAARQKAAAAVLEVDTFGGRVDAATEIRDSIMEAGLPVAAFVRGRAWSAGALIVLACHRVVMEPGASIGAAETRPKEEKTISAVRSEFEATAEARGRRPDVAAAMVDADVEIPGLKPKGKILSLTASEARRVGVADFVQPDLPSALAALGLAGHRVETRRPAAAEKVARFVTGPLVSQILLSLGLLGLAFEIITPGWGVPGTAGLICLALFFGGRAFVGVTGWEAAALFAAGLALLLVEALVVPGFGLVGLAGVACVLGSIVLSFSSRTEALVAVGVAAATLAVGVPVMARLALGRSVWGRLVLRHSEDTRSGYRAHEPLDWLVGHEGVALTALRPSGVARIDGRRVDVITDGEFVSIGTRVVAVKAEGRRLVVEAAGDQVDRTPTDKPDKEE